MSSKKRILFVDDELHILRGLRRTMSVMRDSFEMAFVQSGAEALALLAEAETDYDVIITDMRMPGMSGVQLLSEVKQRAPHMIRIVLSGQADTDSALRAATLSHQYLSKPCNATTLKATLERTFALHRLLATEELQRLVAQLEVIPSLPTLYNQLISELETANVSMKNIGEIIAQDIGMSSKLLQLVNSAYFGVPRLVSDPWQAVTLLGLNIIKMLVLSISLFDQFDQDQMSVRFRQAVQHHSLTVGMLARELSKLEAGNTQEHEQAFTAGLLHDVGKLVLATNFPQTYAEVLTQSKAQGRMVAEVEAEIFGTSHAEVGAYLLGLWGLPTPIIEALAFHHQPLHGSKHNFCTLAAVYVANNLLHNRTLDANYLSELQRGNRLAVWQAVCDKKMGPRTSDEQ
ncbi:MAG: HDOD domain-containing protein [Anaerolineae bacterium]|nr:HDOD domain-containing protein [Anaerolineae bacterium]